MKYYWKTRDGARHEIRYIDKVQKEIDALHGIEEEKFVGYVNNMCKEEFGEGILMMEDLKLNKEN